MNKKLFLMLFVAGATLGASAQKLDASKVPASVKATFAKQFPGIEKVKWEKEGAAYEAGFKKDGQTMAAMFTPEGVLTESEVEIPVSSLPAPVKEYVKAHYKGAIKEAAKITKANGEINFEAEVDGMDRLFDTNGKYLKSVKD
jgi:hypothetical protein